jgi:hypothetical protein
MYKENYMLKQEQELTPTEQQEIATDLLTVAAQGAEINYMYSEALLAHSPLFNLGCAQVPRRPGAE